MEFTNGISNEHEQEQEALSPFRTPGSLSRVLGQYDPERMKLTEQEHERAVAIKDMVEGLPDLDGLSDLMCAQLAIICQDDLEDAIKRCYGMQDFRQEYNILDTYSEGFRLLQFAFDLFPEQHILFDFHEREGSYAFAFDIEKFRPEELVSSQMYVDWMKQMYYANHLFTPDIESMRKGVVCMVECEGMTLRKDVLKHFSAVFSQLLSYYPIRMFNRHYHTTAMVNVISSMLRKIAPKEIKDAFLFGCQFDGHLGKTCLVPTVEAANQRMLGNMQAALKLRYQNEKYFSLDDAS